MRSLALIPVIFAATLMVMPARSWAAAAQLDFPPTKLTIYNSEGTETIGHALYSLETVGGRAFVHGENRYFDGEYDIENDEIEVKPSDGLQRLLTFRHEYFAPDGSPKIVDAADLKAGTGSCTVFEGGTPVANKKTFDFPRDTYAGAAVLIPLQDSLRRGVTAGISFHDFNCVPEPKVFKVRATASPPAPWEAYPRRVVKVRVKPDFGWINFVISPFVPEIDAWFDPADDWRFVGGRFARYYKGRKILLVREPPAAQGSRSDSGS